MFPGRTNNEMLRLMMAVKGKFMNKQVRTHLRAYEVLSLEPHFDPDLRFRQYEMDQITGDGGITDGGREGCEPCG
jgi:serine/threonine-protein kinase PRP4